MSEILSVVAQLDNVAQAATSSTWVDAPVLRSVSESDAARLADLLSIQSTQAPAAVPASAPVGNSMGDAILRNMDSLGRSYQERTTEINSFLEVDGPQLTTTGLLRLQAQLIDSSLMVDVVSKGVSKLVQDIDQMTKLQ